MYTLIMFYRGWNWTMPRVDSIKFARQVAEETLIPSINTSIQVWEGNKRVGRFEYEFDHVVWKPE